MNRLNNQLYLDHLVIWYSIRFCLDYVFFDYSLIELNRQIFFLSSKIEKKKQQQPIYSTRNKIPLKLKTKRKKKSDDENRKLFVFLSLNSRKQKIPFVKPVKQLRSRERENRIRIEFLSSSSFFLFMFSNIGYSHFFRSLNRMHFQQKKKFIWIIILDIGFCFV